MVPRVVYHIAELGDWKTVVEEQFMLLQEVGLNHGVRVTHVGRNLDFVRHLADLCVVDIQIVRSDPNTDHYETFAMLEVERLAREDGDAPILYLHTKGVSEPSRHKTAWRQAMQTHLIYPWRENIRYIVDGGGYDAVGYAWVDWGEQHFSGNFWMARADWIRRLPPFAAYHGRQGLNRFSCEKWIGAQQWCRAYSVGIASPRCHVSEMSDAEVVASIGPYPERVVDGQVIRVNQASGIGKIGDTAMTEPVLTSLSLKYGKPVQLSLRKEHHALFEDHPHIQVVEARHPDPHFVTSLSRAHDISTSFGRSLVWGYFPYLGALGNLQREHFRLYCSRRNPKFEGSVLVFPYSYSCVSHDHSGGYKPGVRPNVQAPLSFWDEMLPQVRGPKFVICGSDPNHDTPHDFPTAERIDGMPLCDTVAAINSARLCIGVNTGLAHLAGGSDTPLVLIGNRGAAYDPRCAAKVAADYLDEVRVADVLDAVAGVRGLSRRVRIGIGELVDRITILRIKEREIGEVQEETRQYETQIAGIDLGGLDRELYEINYSMWKLLEEIKVDPESEAAIPAYREVFYLNKRRAGLKRSIDDVTKSVRSEIKSVGLMNDA